MSRYLAGLTVAAVICCGVAAPTTVTAQVSGLESRCVMAGGTTFACAFAADVADIAGAHAAILGAGGSPVLGTASTLGQRTPGTPRIGITARLTAASIALPDPAAQGSTQSAMAFGWNADLAIGIVDGIAAWETVGGVGSLDVLASVGVLNMPAGAGFEAKTPVTWSAGLRVGFLRESFTVPGLSLSGMYRRIGALSTGDPGANGLESRVRLDRTAVWSVRGVIGKRISLFGVTGGIGYDRFSPDITAHVDGGAGSLIRIADESLTAGRITAFGGLTWTALVYNLVAELGWQDGGGLAEDRQPASAAGGGGFYLTIGGRVII